MTKIFSNASSKNRDWRKALTDCTASLKKAFAGQSCDLLVFFVSEAYKNLKPEEFCRELSVAFPSQVLIGCNSSGVVAGDAEIEMEPAISMLAMKLPDVKLIPFSMTPEAIESVHQGSDLINAIDIYPTDKPHFLCLADPMSTDVTKILQAFNEGYKGLPVVGGLASGAVMNKPNWLCLNQTIHLEGLVGLAMTGNIQFEVLVSQGCRPVGKPYVVTKADDNVLYELAGRPSLEVVRELFEMLSDTERALAEQSLCVGLVMNEQQTSFKRGDFLIRNIMGFDPDNGSLMIGAHLKLGQTLQFQIRDAGTSTEDLKLTLEKLSTENGAPRGGVLVSCCGRGKAFFGESHHDAKLIQSMKGPLPLTGFFANGEIGPVGQKNFVHGYTSSLVIFH